MPYLACLPRLSFVPATAQQFRRSTYLNPLESPHNINYFTGLSFLKARLWIACPIRQTAQSRVFKSYLLEPNRAQFSLTFVWLPFTFQRPNHCLARPPALQAQPHIKTTTLPSIRIFLAFLASPYLNHTTLFTSVGATYLTFLPCIIPAISCIHSST